jgi:hypothetical protein
METFHEIRQVKAKYEKDLLDKANVVGVGIGYREEDHIRTDEVSILVLVRQKLPLTALPPEDVVPTEVNGVRTDVVEVGEIRAMQERTDRWRPAPGGVSIGHYQITAGTFGGVVVDRASGARLILSNNHVLANSNDGNPGDAILQPGAADGGNTVEDVIAHLERFCPIQFSVAPPVCGIANAYAGIGNFIARLLGSSHRLQAYQVHPAAVNQVDAAVARPTDDGAILDEILEIGVVTGTAPVTLGMPVRKSGRTTGFSTGEVTVLDATVDVSYGLGRTARFENQFLSGPMSQGGDSGSLLVAGEAPLAVGLLFAGSNQTTVYNPIQFVLDCLEVNIGSGQPAVRSEQRGIMEQAHAVKQAHEQELMSKPNVVGVGVGTIKKEGQQTGQVGLVVMVRRKVPRSQLSDEEAIPDEIEGVPVDVQEVGEIRAQ